MSYVASESGQTFIFADLAGFTALTEAHGDEDAADLATEFCERTRVTTGRVGGAVVKTIGDAVMIRCDDPKDAIELALTIIDEEHTRAGSPAVRIGMSTGPAVERGGDWFGATVNLAARVSAVAAGGEVVITQATVDEAGSLEQLELQRLGNRSFKNVTHPVAIYRVVRRGSNHGDLMMDPVCRMVVAEEAEVGSLTFEGTTFHFCSLKCAQRFAADPEDFAHAD